MEQTIKARIPNGLYDEVQKEIKNERYVNEADIIRAALREFFAKKKARRIDLAVDALSSLIEGGPEKFKKKLREEVNGRE